MGKNIYTRRGDAGETSLFGGRRVAKDHPRMVCAGELDEVNSLIGMLRSKLEPAHEFYDLYFKIQKELMDIMSHVASPSDAVQKNPNPLPESPLYMEKLIDQLEERMGGKSKHFLVPGGNEVASLLHIIRTVIRRAERSLCSVMREDHVPSEIAAYINRMSDMFFVLARYELFTSKILEERWQSFLYKKKEPNEK